ncbi:uncharacterized protein LOC124613411 [Schistocerca americana]|uniref:uncharacterized protein LOC124613411 n=1 Tax=Schistocerca americana TaxID=7009 RepID=UPI001F4F3050|nr:uncharacterized protein LOC124613411 [Schistocerca americana]
MEELLFYKNLETINLMNFQLKQLCLGTGLWTSPSFRNCIEKPNTAVKVAICIVNKIKSSAVNISQWLSKGNMLSRQSELKSDQELFLLSQGKTEVYHLLSDDSFIFSLAYLADFFVTLNNLSPKLQATIMDGNNTVMAWLEKTQLLKSHGQWCDVSEWIVVSSEHEELLQKDFERYFLQLSLEGCQQDHSSQLICMYFLIKFRVADEALQALIRFSSPYLCENGFLTLAILKINHHSLLKMETDLRHATSAALYCDPHLDKVLPLLFQVKTQIYLLL